MRAKEHFKQDVKSEVKGTVISSNKSLQKFNKAWKKLNKYSNYSDLITYSIDLLDQGYDGTIASKLNIYITQAKT